MLGVASLFAARTSQRPTEHSHAYKFGLNPDTAELMFASDTTLSA